MLEIKNTAKSTSIDLALPESGFSTELLEELSVICTEYSREINAGYLVLKKDDEDISLLIGLLFSKQVLRDRQEVIIKNILTNVVDLFSDDVPIDAMSLNNHDQLKNTISSMTNPFYNTNVA